MQLRNQINFDAAKLSIVTPQCFPMDLGRTQHCECFSCSHGCL